MMALVYWRRLAIRETNSAGSWGIGMLQAWETFYLVVGTSAGALVGVMFIVATLTAELAVDQLNRGTIIYQSPTVFHLGVIVAVGALALIPDHLISFAAVLFAVLGTCGFVYTGLTLWRTFERYDFYQATQWDRLFFGVLPAICYLLMIAGGAAVFWAPEVAAELVAAATLLLLLVSIRNAWDIATFSVRLTRNERINQKHQE